MERVKIRWLENQAGQAPKTHDQTANYDPWGNFLNIFYAILEPHLERERRKLSFENKHPYITYALRTVGLMS